MDSIGGQILHSAIVGRRPPIQRHIPTQSTTTTFNPYKKVLSSGHFKTFGNDNSVSKVEKVDAGMVGMKENTDPRGEGGDGGGNKDRFINISVDSKGYTGNSSPVDGLFHQRLRSVHSPVIPPLNTRSSSTKRMPRISPVGDPIASSRGEIVQGLMRRLGTTGIVFNRTDTTQHPHSKQKRWEDISITTPNQSPNHHIPHFSHSPILTPPPLSPPPRPSPNPTLSLLSTRISAQIGRLTDTMHVHDIILRTSIK